MKNVDERKRMSERRGEIGADIRSTEAIGMRASPELWMDDVVQCKSLYRSMAKGRTGSVHRMSLSLSVSLFVRRAVVFSARGTSTDGCCCCCSCWRQVTKEEACTALDLFGLSSHAVANIPLSKQASLFFFRGSNSVSYGSGEGIVVSGAGWRHIVWQMS